jgi:hypothetical protein
MADTEELCSTKLRLWSRLVTGHQLFGTRYVVERCKTVLTCGLIYTDFYHAGSVRALTL